MSPMKRTPPAVSPDAYAAALRGWRRTRVDALRRAIRGAAPLDEVIKWGNVVYFANGPVMMIRAEATRVLFGFWRGQRLREIEPRLEPGGKYEMATLTLRQGMTISPAVVRRLVKTAVMLNRTLGNPATAVKEPR